MDLTPDSLFILIVLLPGFVSTAILNGIIVRKDHTNLTRLFEALAFSFLAYGSTAFVVSLYSQIGVSQSSDTEVSALFLTGRASTQIALMLGFTVVYPLVIGTFITHDWHMKVLRSLKVTNKPAGDNMWSETLWRDVFTEQAGRYVVANLTDGTRILGWPMYYSDTPEEGSIYLHEPRWIDDNGIEHPMDRHGILIKKEVIESLEFTRELS